MAKLQFRITSRPQVSRLLGHVRTVYRVERRVGWLFRRWAPLTSRGYYGIGLDGEEYPSIDRAAEAMLAFTRQPDGWRPV